MDIQEIINIDPDILGGQPVFTGTRIPVESFLDQLEAGISMESFLNDFPTVKREQAVALLKVANELLTSNAAQIYARAA